MQRRFHALMLVGSWFALAACGSDPVGSDGDDDGGSSGSGGAGGGGTSTAGKSSVSCDPGPGYAEATEPRVIDSVSATLVDLDDRPVSGELVQVCGTDICINGESTDSGGVVIDPMQAITKPAFKFGEGKESARFAWLLPDGSSIDLGIVRTVLLPDVESGVDLVAGESASSGGLTLLPAADGAITIDRLTFREPSEQRLRAIAVPLDRAPEVVDRALGFELVYAATPVDTRFCPPAALSVDNSEGWEPGSAVEVWLHGVDIAEEWAPYGGWAKVSEAEVSADGSRIETTTPGLPMLGVLGFKRP